MINKLNIRFSDFNNQKYKFALFTNPFAVDFCDSPQELQMELIEIEWSDDIKTKIIIANKISPNIDKIVS